MSFNSEGAAGCVRGSRVTRDEAICRRLEEIADRIVERAAPELLAEWAKIQRDLAAEDFMRPGGKQRMLARIFNAPFDRGEL